MSAHRSPCADRAVHTIEMPLLKVVRVRPIARGVRQNKDSRFDLVSYPMHGASGRPILGRSVQSNARQYLTMDCVIMTVLEERLVCVCVHSGTCEVAERHTLKFLVR